MKYVLLILDPNINVNHLVGMGLAEELQKDGPWHVRVREPNLSADCFKDLLIKSRPEFVVARNLTLELGSIVEELAVPYIAIAHHLHTPVYSERDPKYIVNPDEEAIGTMAAEYLLGQGFENFAVVSHVPPNPGTRIKAFVDAIAQQEKSLDTYFFEPPASGASASTVFVLNDHLTRWLHQLPKPCAVFVYSDEYGAEIVTNCMETGLRVPDDISVLSVDDNRLYCHTAVPNLASIRLSYQRLGIEAARIILNPPSEKVVVNVPPSVVVERASCRPPHRGDLLVDKALEYLRTRVEESVRVSDLLKLTGLTPNQLVYRFHKSTGQSPMDMILNQRIARAKQLLTETSDSVASISVRCGFKSPNRFYLAFLDAVGMSPRSYRNRIEQKTI
jgi:LacI family transcriptional regulator